jgi:hypothetical protein
MYGKVEAPEVSMCLDTLHVVSMSLDRGVIGLSTLVTHRALWLCPSFPHNSYCEEQGRSTSATDSGRVFSRPPVLYFIVPKMPWVLRAHCVLPTSCGHTTNTWRTRHGGTEEARVQS